MALASTSVLFMIEAKCTLVASRLLASKGLCRRNTEHTDGQTDAWPLHCAFR